MKPSGTDGTDRIDLFPETFAGKGSLRKVSGNHSVSSVPSVGDLRTLAAAVRRADAALTAAVDAHGRDGHGERLPNVQANVAEALRELVAVLMSEVDRE